jgi:hypothetical protein
MLLQVAQWLPIAPPLKPAAEVPAGHWLQLDAPTPLSVPGGQLAHAVLLLTFEYVWAGQLEHESAAVLLKNAPAGHTLHCDAFVAPAGLVAPYPHDVHSALPADENVFAEQVVQPAEVAGAAADGGRLFVTSVVDSEVSE